MKNLHTKNAKDSSNVFMKLGVFAFSLLFTVFAVYLYSPVVGTNATDTENNSSGNEPTISLTLSTEALSFSITPTSYGVFSSKLVKATIETDSTGGYELYFSSSNGETDMTSMNPNVSDVIASDFNGTATSSTMENNKWGYSLDNSDFLKVPTLSNQVTIKDVDHLPGYDETTTSVYIGAKISSTLPTGTYSKDVVFTAIAHPMLAPPFNGITTMQEMTGELCYAARTGATATLRDTRDGKDYTVRKLADGNCWMINNLRIGGDEPITLHPADSNVAADFELPASPVSTTSSDFSAQNTKNIYVDSANGYYNFYTATAGEGGTDKNSGDVEHSICPKGWRLPTGDASGEYGALYGYYGSSSAMMNPDGPNFTYTGYVNRGSFYSQNSEGRYWTSTIKSPASMYSYSDAYYLYMNSSNTNASYSYDKTYGFSIRCIAPGVEPEQPADIHSITNMQEMTPEICSATEENDTATLIDNRGDNSSYSILKAKDGRCWMTKNLSLTDATITNEDSDISASSFYVPGNNWGDSMTSNSKMNNPYVYVSQVYGPSYGYLYNYAAASAGTISGTSASGDATESICPKGWKLPSQTEYNALLSAYEVTNDTNGSVIIRSEPLNFMGTVGIISYNSTTTQNDTFPGFANWWTSTNSSGNYMYVFHMDGYSAHANNGGMRRDGFHIRCVARTE